MALRKPQRSLVRREANGLLAAAEQLAFQVGEASSKGMVPLIENPQSLHSYLTRIQDHLVQLQTLVQHRSKS